MQNDLYSSIINADFEALRRFLAVQGSVDATVAVPFRDSRLHNTAQETVTPMVVTPLMAAAKLGSYDAVKILVSSNCNVNLTTSVSGSTRTLYKRSFQHPDFWANPLILACAGSHTEIVNLLLRARASPDKKSIFNHRLDAVTPLHVACSIGSFQVVDALLRYGARVNVVCLGYLPLHIACRSGNCDIVSLLVRNGSSVNGKDDTFGCTPLHECSKLGHTNVVMALLASGAHVDALTSIQNVDFVRAHQTLLPDVPLNGSRNFACGVSPLMLAIAGAHWEVAHALLQHKSDPNVQDVHGRGALHYLCGRRATESEAEIRLFHVLLKQGADVHRRDHKGFKGLHYAAAMNKSQLVDVWVAQLGRHINDKATSKDTSLHLACTFGSEAVVSVLLESGKFVQSYNNDGMLPIHLACAHGHYQIVEIVLRRGICRPDTPTLAGESGSDVRDGVSNVMSCPFFLY